MAMEEGRLAYRVRTAEPGDDARLRPAIGTTLAHPDKQGKRESYRGAAERGELLLLERYDRQEREWHAAGFIEHHLRVDDTLTIRDMGTAGEQPQPGVVRYLLDAVFDSLRPVAATVKIRRDAGDWLDIFRAVPGFVQEGEEYRRPHYWTIWDWNPARAREAQQPRRERDRPRPAPPAGGARPQTAPERPPATGGPRPNRDARPPARGDGGPARPFRGGGGSWGGGPRRAGPGAPRRGGPGSGPRPPRPSQG